MGSFCTVPISVSLNLCIPSTISCNNEVSLMTAKDQLPVLRYSRSLLGNIPAWCSGCGAPKKKFLIICGAHSLSEIFSRSPLKFFFDLFNNEQLCRYLHDRAGDLAHRRLRSDGRLFLFSLCIVIVVVVLLNSLIRLTVNG